MNLSRVKAIVRKDLFELRANKMAVVPMIIVPVILCAVLPGALAFLSLRLDISAINGAELIEQILPFYSIPEVFDTTVRQVIYVFLNYMFLPFFMLIPVMVSSIVAANAVVGEKERKTLETLLYTPVTNREFVVAKTLSAFVPAVAVSLIGFAGFFVVVNGISLALDRFTEGVVARRTLMISMRAKSFMEAQQMSAVVVIPVLLLVIAQFTGIFVLSIWHILGFGALLVVADIVLLTKIGPRFEREAILKTL